MEWYKNKFFLGALVVVVAASFFVFRGGDENNDRENDRQDESNAELRDGEIAVEGEIACLPYNITVAGQDCVKALKGADGKMYALNTIEVNRIENTFEVGTKVSAVGVFEVADRSVNDSSVFSYDGVLVVRKLEKK